MINYLEKGSGLHDRVHEAGHWLRQENGIWMSSDDTVVQAIIDIFDPFPEVRDAKWEEIKAERDKRQVAGVRVGSNRFHSDEKSRIQQLGLVIMGANIPSGLLWKTLDKIHVPMTPALAGQVFMATGLHDQAVFAAAEAHNLAMRQSADPANYDFSTGWPAV